MDTSSLLSPGAVRSDAAEASSSDPPPKATPALVGTPSKSVALPVHTEPMRSRRDWLFRNISRAFSAKAEKSSVADAAYLNSMPEPPPSEAMGVGKAKMLCGEPVLCVALSALRFSSEAEQFFAVGTTDNKVFLYRLRDCMRLHVFDVPKKGNSGVNAIVFVHVGEHLKLIIGGYGGQVIAFDAAEHSIDAQLDFKADVLTMAVSRLSDTEATAVAAQRQLLAVAGKPVEVSLYHVILVEPAAAGSEPGGPQSEPASRRIRFEPIVKLWYGAMVMSVAMSVDASLLAIGGEAKTVKLIELIKFRAAQQAAHEEDESGKYKLDKKTPPAVFVDQPGDSHRAAVHTFHFSSAVHSIALTPSGDKLAVGSADRVDVWEIAKPESSRIDKELCVEKLFELDQGTKEGAVAFDDTGGRLAIGAGLFCQVLSMITGAPVRTLPRLDGRVRCVALAQRGFTLIHGGFDKHVNVYSADEGARFFQFGSGPVSEACPTGQMEAFAVAAADSERGRMVAIGGEHSVGQEFKGITRVYDMDTSVLIDEWLREKKVFALAFTRDGRQCAVGGYDSQVVIHDVFNKTVQVTLLYEAPNNQMAWIWSVSFSADSRRMAVGCWNYFVYVYDNVPQYDHAHAADGEKGDMVDADDEEAEDADVEDSRLANSRCVNKTAMMLLAESNRVYGVTLSGDGEKVLVGGRNKSAVLYEVNPPRFLWKFECSDVIYSVSLSTDASLCALGGQFGSVHILSGHTGGLLRSIPVNDTIRSVHLIPDTKKVLFGGDEGLLTLWSQERGEEMCIPLSESIQGVFATEQSLLCAKGKTVIMFGKGKRDYGWKDHPSFSVVTELLRNKDHAQRSLRSFMSTHPEIVNSRDINTGESFLQHCIRNSNDISLLEIVLQGEHKIGLSRDQYGRTPIKAAIERSRKAAVRMLISAVIAGRVSRVPSALEPIVECFERLAYLYPREFVRLLRDMPLDEEPGVLGPDEHEMPIKETAVRGHHLRYPVTTPTPWAHLNERNSRRTWCSCCSCKRVPLRDRSQVHPDRGVFRTSAHGISFEERSGGTLYHRAQDEAGEATERTKASASGSRSGNSVQLIRKHGTAAHSAAKFISGLHGSESDAADLAHQAAQQASKRVQVKALRVPFCDFAGYYRNVGKSPLYLIIMSSEAARDRSVFSSEIVRALLRHKWQAYARSLFLFQAAMYCLYIAMNTVYAWLYLLALRDGVDVFDPSPRNRWLLFMWVYISGFLFYSSVLEVMQARVVPLHIYALGAWNLIDLLAIIMQFTINTLFWFRPFTKDDSAYDLIHNLLGIQLTLCYLQLMSFFRGFEVGGPLIRMIAKILADILPFLAVLVIVLLGFAMGLSILLYKNGEDFGGLRYALVSTLNYGLYGEFTGNDFFQVLSNCYDEEEQTDCSLNVSALLLFTGMMIFVQIVMLNLLIAIMTDSYDNVRENSMRESAYEKAKLILELETTWLPPIAWVLRRPLNKDFDKFPRWLHVLKPLDEQGESETHDWNGRMHAFRQEINNISKELERHGKRTITALSDKTEALGGQLAAIDVLHDAMTRMERSIHDLQGVMERANEPHSGAATPMSSPSTQRPPPVPPASSGMEAVLEAAAPAHAHAPAAASSVEEAAEQPRESTLGRLSLVAAQAPKQAALEAACATPPVASRQASELSCTDSRNSQGTDSRARQAAAGGSNVVARQPRPSQAALNAAAASAARRARPSLADQASRRTTVELSASSTAHPMPLRRGGAGSSQGLLIPARVSRSEPSQSYEEGAGDIDAASEPMPPIFSRTRGAYMEASISGQTAPAPVSRRKTLSVFNKFIAEVAITQKFERFKDDLVEALDRRRHGEESLRGTRGGSESAARP